jgi:hypothetical protein
MIPHLPVLASDTALVKIGNEIGYKVMTSAGLNWSDTLTNLATPYDLTQISGGYWSKLQHHVYTTDASDSVMIGASSSPVGLFEVYNRLRLDDDKYSVYIGNTAGGTYVAANNNVGIGDAALSFLNDGEFNTAIGSNAGGSIIDGIGNTVLGGGALLNGEGNYNTLIGYNALTHDDVAYNNIAIGHNAGGQAHGDTSIYIGRYSGFWNTLNDRFFLNNKQKSNIVGDTTQSMFYGYFNANPALQRLTFNSKLYFPLIPTDTATYMLGVQIANGKVVKKVISGAGLNWSDTLTTPGIATPYDLTQVGISEIKPLCGTGVDTTAINKDDKFLLGYSEGIVIDTIVYILQRRAGSPDITAVISYGKDISAAGTALIAAGSNITSYTTATKVSSFDGTPSISAGNMIWMTLPTITVSPRSIHVVLIGHRL